MENDIVARDENEVWLQELIETVPKPFDVWGKLMQKHPGDTVLSDTFGHRLSRREVDDVANRVNGYLREHRIRREDVVMIHLDRGVRPFLAAMGVWKAGAAFCLVESDYAEERVAFIKNDCQARIVLDERTWPEVMAADPCADIAPAEDHDAAMYVYTSGTTGTPKGVLHEYGQIRMEMVSERRSDGTWRENRKTKWALGAPLNFVASLKILVHFIYSGGHLHILGYDTVKNPRELDAYFLTQRINETFLAPMHLRIRKGNAGPFMKYVYTGAAPANNVSLKKGELVNTYTMTESFFTVTEFVIDKPYEACPIGAPLFDLGLRLVDEDGNDVAPGEAGEIAFPNPYCRGYVNLPEESARRFRNGLFHTKDLASFANGMYTMRGRIDDMVKINGNRVEPQEIEACFERLTGIRCVAKCFSDDSDGFIALYYSTEGGAQVDVQDVRERMEAELPYYMIPSHFVPIEKIPETQLGKVDRKQLRKPRAKCRPYVAPETPLEEKLCVAVAKQLGLPRVGRDDDVFELGASSLDIIAFLGDDQAFHQLSADFFYRGRTISGIAALAEEHMRENRALTEEEMEEEGRKHLYPLRDAAEILYKIQRSAPEQTDTLVMASAFKLSRFVDLKKLRDAINAYTEQSSTFNTLLAEGGEGSALYRYAPELRRPVEIEYLSEEEVRQLQVTFVAPFRLTEELPWRIRLVKTRHARYLFFSIHHVLTDGEGLNLIASNILNLYAGKDVRPDRFYAWLYKEEILYGSRYFQECKQRMHERFDETDWAAQPEDRTGEVGMHSKEFDTGISLDDLNARLRELKKSRSELFLAALALAMYRATGKPDVALGYAYANRTGEQNVAGVRVRTLTLGFDMRDLPSTVPDYLDMVGREFREGIATACYCYRYRTQKIGAITPIVDDLEDLEEPHPLLARFAEPIDLGQAAQDGADVNTEPSVMACVFNYVNKEGRLLIRFKRDVHWLSDDARDAFVEQNIRILQRLLAGDDSVLGA